MTWPFENDTSNIEKKLAKRSLHHERQVSTSPEFPVQENPSGWTNWCCVSACGINGKSGSLARKIPPSSIISAN